MAGSVNILNVAGGDIKLTFDKNNLSESIRAKRIIKDCLRRGYALLVEVERNGEKAFERALDFREETGEYIIVDYDPEATTASVKEPSLKVPIVKEEADGEGGQEEVGEEDRASTSRVRRGRGRKAIDASTTRAVAVSRSAGG